MPEILTIGHAARPWEEFASLLERHGVEILADVRRHPGSRNAPWFNGDHLLPALAARDIDHVHLAALGGRRRSRPDSPNTSWRNASFRGYADYMETPEFEAGLAELVALAQAHRVAIMCAETVWWRCHRSLISDALTARGWQVWHILDEGAPKPHRYTAPARIVNGTLTYHPEPDQPSEESTTSAP